MRLTKQYNTTHPKTVLFKEKKLPQVGLEPATYCVLGRCSTNSATEAAQLAGAELHVHSNTTQGKVSLNLKNKPTQT